MSDLGHEHYERVGSSSATRMSPPQQLKIERFSGVTLGATVTGCDLSKIDDATFGQILDAFHEHAVLVFPKQFLSPEAQTAFGKRFGEIEHGLVASAPAHDYEFFALSNTKPDGSVHAIGSPGWLTAIGNESWHVDSTYTPRSAKVGILSAAKLPLSGGGETAFADMRAAYDVLDEATKSKLDGLMAYHSVQVSMAAIGLFSPKNGHGESGVGYLRPLVKVHPVTGRKALFGGRHAFGIPGMTPEDSEEFLDHLFESACQPPRVLEHSWSLGDLVVWDNRCILHRARPYDYTEPRDMRGTRVAGEQTEWAVEGTPEAEASREVVQRELARHKLRFERDGKVPGNGHLRSAL